MAEQRLNEVRNPIGESMLLKRGSNDNEGHSGKSRSSAGWRELRAGPEKLKLCGA